MERVVEEIKLEQALVLLGAPASGKSTHSEQFVENHDALLIRGKDVCGDIRLPYEKKRQTVPDDIFIPRLKGKLREVLTAGYPIVVFDNIPRTSIQAQEIIDWANNNGIGLHSVVLSLTKDEVLYRFNTREVCPKCDTSYHPILKPSRTVGICESDQAPLSRKLGDDPTLVESAYDAYRNMIEDVQPVLEKAASSFSAVVADGTIYQVSQKLESILRNFYPSISYIS